LITKFGKRFLTNFIAGNTSFSNKEIAIGIANNTEYPLSDTNSRLGFEFYRIPARAGGIDIDASVTPTKYTVIYSATIPTNVAGKINEVGLYPGERSSKNYFDSKLLYNFELPYDWTTHDVVVSGNTITTPSYDPEAAIYRVGAGDSGLNFICLPNSTLEWTTPVSLDLSGYSQQDSITFAFSAPSINNSSIKIKFYSSDNNYYEFDFSTSGTGNFIIEKPFSTGTAYGSPNIQNINKMGFVLTGGSGAEVARVRADAIRINDEDTFDPTYGLIARSILPAEITKVLGRESQIEFKLDLSFGD
jgi:hypothetical protein